MKRELHVRFCERLGVQLPGSTHHRSGFCVWTKRLEEGRFVSDWGRVATRQMDWTGLKLLLEGIEPRVIKKRYKHNTSVMPMV
jgi:transposase